MWLRNFAVMILFALSIPVVTIGAIVGKGLLLHPKDGETNPTVQAYITGTDDPFLDYDVARSRWRFSNDGVEAFDMGSGSGGGAGGQDNLFFDPGFEQEDELGDESNKPICSIGPGTAKIFDRTTRATPLDKKVVGLYPTSDGTWNISCSWVVERVDFNGESMLAGASVRNFGTVTDAKITVLVDDEEVWTKGITDTETKHVYPIVGGSKYEIKVEGRMEGFNEFEPVGWNRIEVDDLYLGTIPDGYFQSIAYENYEEIDLTGSGDFTGGKIAVGRVGNQVTVSIIEAISNDSTDSPSAIGVIPEWGRPKASVSRGFIGISGGKIAQIAVSTVGTLNFWLYEEDLTFPAFTGLLETRQGSITYLAADAKERTNVFEQKAQSPDKAGFLTFSFFEGEVEGHKVADGSCVKKADYPDYFRNVGTKYGECTVDTANDGVNLPSLQQDGGLFVRAATASNAVGTVQGDAIRNITGSLRTLLFSTSHSTTVFSGPFYNWGSNPGGSASGTNGGSKMNVGFDASRSVPTASENRPVNMAVYPLVRMWDRETVVGMFKASQIKGLKKKCQKKYLSSAITETGPIADWAFSGLTVGRVYKLEYSAYCIPSGTPTRCEVYGTNGGSIYAWSLLDGRGKLGGNEYFTATASELTINASVLTNAELTVSGALSVRTATLCELPPDTIEFTDEW